MLPTLVFVFGGNAFAEAKPDRTTQLAAAQLAQLGDRAIQLTTPAMNGPGAFYQLANAIRGISQGRPIGLMGFSAGGALAMRLAGFPGLNVQAVMNYYSQGQVIYYPGPQGVTLFADYPAFRDYLAHL
jgi:dienelactone hydrolase